MLEAREAQDRKKRPRMAAIRRFWSRWITAGRMLEASCRGQVPLLPVMPSRGARP